MTSISKNLSRALFAVTAIILLILGLYLVQVIDRRISNVFDESSLNKIRNLATLMEFEPYAGGFEFEFTDEIMPEFSRVKQPEYFQLRLQSGERVQSSTSLGTNSLPLLGVALNQTAVKDIVLPNGDAGRLVEMLILPWVDLEDRGEEEVEEKAEAGNNVVDTVQKPLLENKPILVSYARERESLNRLINTIRVMIVVGMLGALILQNYLMKRVVANGLKPLNLLAAQIEEIDEAALGQRLKFDGDELCELVPIRDQVNLLLGRIENSFERVKLFSSNVAHELNTPLAELRLLSEVAVKVPDDKQQIIAFFKDVGAASLQMQNTVNSLLDLARFEDQSTVFTPSEFQLKSMVDESWSQLDADDRAGKTLINSVPDNLLIYSDKEKLRIAVRNIVMNACYYSSPDSEVNASVSHDGAHAHLTISNTTDQLEAEDIEKMSDRFWRKEAARSDSSHVGLGLSIVDVITKALGLELTLELASEDRFHVHLNNLPISAPA